jgi:hypothetical protein
MPVFTIKEVAEMCSMEPKNIHTYISRGKLIKRKDGLIDDTKQVNKEFLCKYKVWDKSEIEKCASAKLIEIKPNRKEQKLSKEEKPFKQKPASEKEDGEIPEHFKAFVSANELNKLKAEKLREEIEILKLKNKVQSGDLIPISAAENVTSVHFNSITAIFFNAIDNEISDICNELGVERERLTAIRGKLRQILNLNVIKAKEKSKKDLIAAAQNYEETENKNEQQNES